MWNFHFKKMLAQLSSRKKYICSFSLVLFGLVSRDWAAAVVLIIKNLTAQTHRATSHQKSLHNFLLLMIFFSEDLCSLTKPWGQCMRKACGFTCLLVRPLGIACLPNPDYPQPNCLLKNEFTIWFVSSYLVCPLSQAHWTWLSNRLIYHHEIGVLLKKISCYLLTWAPRVISPLSNTKKASHLTEYFFSSKGLTVYVICTRSIKINHLINSLNLF